MPYKTRDEDGHRPFEDDTVMHNLELDTTKSEEYRRKLNDLDDLNKDNYFTSNQFTRRFTHIISRLCCCFIFTNSQGYLTICGKKLNVKSRYNINEISSHNKRIYSGNEHTQQNSNKNHFDYSNDIERSEHDLIGQPIKCIRVLRPSNDLTPVRFDSHYNIIQTYNTDNTSLICSNEVQINDTVSENASMPYMDNEAEASENNSLVKC